jgi:hypothetical protein
MSTAPTPTAARVFGANSAHWYSPEGEAKYQIPTVDGKKMKVPTLADARKHGFLPSVTTILDAILRKPALEAWKTEQAVLACLTTPRKEGEGDDAFVHRVLQEEQQQTEEAKSAADLGTKIHAAMEGFFQGQALTEDNILRPWIMPAAEAVMKYGTVIETEKILVGDGYAGRTDLLQESPECWWLWDFKSAKKLPTKGAWAEHRLQLSAYAQALEKKLSQDSPHVKPVRTGNLYISTVVEGAFVICEHEVWDETFTFGFLPLLTHWQWANQYWPGEAAPKRAPAPPQIILGAGIVIPVAPPTPVKRKVVWAIGQPTPNINPNP